QVQATRGRLPGGERPHREGEQREGDELGTHRQGGRGDEEPDDGQKAGGPDRGAAITARQIDEPERDADEDRLEEREGRPASSVSEGKDDLGPPLLIQP